MFKCKCKHRSLVQCDGCRRYHKFMSFMGWGTMTAAFVGLAWFIIWSQHFSPLARGLREMGL